jgi:hypothetical protein
MIWTINHNTKFKISQIEIQTTSNSSKRPISIEIYAQEGYSRPGFRIYLAPSMRGLVGICVRAAGDYASSASPAASNGSPGGRASRVTWSVASVGAARARATRTPWPAIGIEAAEGRTSRVIWLAAGDGAAGARASRTPWPATGVEAAEGRASHVIWLAAGDGAAGARVSRCCRRDCTGPSRRRPRVSWVAVDYGDHPCVVEAGHRPCVVEAGHPCKVSTGALWSTPIIFSLFLISFIFQMLIT